MTGCLVAESSREWMLQQETSAVQRWIDRMIVKRRLTLAMSHPLTDSSYVVGTCSVCCVACVRLESALDVRCRRREDIVEWSGCRSDSAVLKSAAATYRGRCVRASQVTVQDDYGLCIVVGRTAHRPGCVASLPPRNDRLRRRRICRPPVDNRCACRPVYISL